MGTTTARRTEMTEIVPLRRLFHRFRHGAERAREIEELRTRYRAEQDPTDADAKDVAIARELLQLREALSREFSDTSVVACTRCAKGHPLPYGRWPGGHCCGSRTEALFTSDELLSMKLAGVTLAGMIPPRSEHSGCAFRGPNGCSLSPKHRPNLCVAYMCRDLERELRRRGDASTLLGLQKELRTTFERFTERQSARRHRMLLGEPE